MAFLAPLAAGAAVPATAGAAALAKGAALAGTASTALGAGLSTGAALGGGASMLSMPALSYAGANLAAPGILGALPSAVAPTAGIFAKAAPALGGLSSLTPAVTQAAPGLLQTAGMSPLGGMASVLPAGTSLPGAAGFKSLAMANAPLTAGANPATWNAVNQAAGLGNIGGQAGNLGAQLTKVADVASKAGTNTGLLGQGAKFKELPSVVQNAPSVTSPEYAARAREIFQPSISASGTPIYQSAGYGVPELAKTASTVDPSKGFLSNAVSFAKNPSMQGAMDYIETHPYASAGAAYGLYNLLKPKPKEPPKDVALIRPYEFERTQNPQAYAVSPTADSSERTYFTENFTPLEPYEAPGPEYKRAASGGITSLAVGGPVEQMAAMNSVGANTGYPMAGINTPMYSNPMIQRPEAVNVLAPSGDAGVGAYSGEPKFAGGGLSDLGGYSDGGRLLRGPGDGVSDSIPAVIGERQPARLADGEFVVPARIVSELGNGSTEAGARKLYAMMDRVQKARRKTVGRDRVATNTRADKHLPA